MAVGTNTKDLNDALRTQAVLSLPVACTLAHAATSAGVVDFPPVSAALPNQPDTVQQVVRGRTFHTAAILGTFSGSVTLEATLDQQTWVPLGPALTSAQLVTYRASVNGVRANITALTSGSITIQWQAQYGG